MGRSFGRLIFGVFLGLLLGRALRRRRWHAGRHAGKHHFDPDGPGWERPGWRQHRPHHHHC